MYMYMCKCIYLYLRTYIVYTFLQYVMTTCSKMKNSSFDFGKMTVLMKNLSTQQSSQRDSVYIASKRDVTVIYVHA